MYGHHAPPRFPVKLLLNISPRNTHFDAGFRSGAAKKQHGHRTIFSAGATHHHDPSAVCRILEDKLRASFRAVLANMQAQRLGDVKDHRAMLSLVVRKGGYVMIRALGKSDGVIVPARRSSQTTPARVVGLDCTRHRVLYHRAAVYICALERVRCCWGNRHRVLDPIQ